MVRSRPTILRAFIWVVGRLWTIRVERFIGKSQPGLNCVLFLAGLFLTAHSLLKPFLSESSASGGGMLPAEAAHGLFVLLVFLSVLALVASATSGTASRRVFCTVAFPFLALLGLFSIALGDDLVHAFLAEGGTVLNIVLVGPLFGCVVAVVLALPCVLLYREIAAPLAALALIPAVAKRLDVEGMSRILGPHQGLFGLLWPFLCSLIVLAIFSHVFLTWVSRAPGEHASTAA